MMSLHRWHLLALVALSIALLADAGDKKPSRRAQKLPKPSQPATTLASGKSSPAASAFPQRPPIVVGEVRRVADGAFHGVREPLPDHRIPVTIMAGAALQHCGLDLTTAECSPLAPGFTEREQQQMCKGKPLRFVAADDHALYIVCPEQPAIPTREGASVNAMNAYIAYPFDGARPYGVRGDSAEGLGVATRQARIVDTVDNWKRAASSQNAWYVAINQWQSDLEAALRKATPDRAPDDDIAMFAIDDHTVLFHMLPKAGLAGRAAYIARLPGGVHRPEKPIGTPTH